MLDSLRSQIREIAEDPALRLQGALLSLGHLWGALWWIDNGYARDLSRAGRALCWPFFEDCFRYRFLDEGQVLAVFVAFGALAGVGALLFLHPRLVRAAWLFQLGLNLLKALILFQDFRLRMNQHYMLLFATLVFLFLPGKRALLRYTLVAFYVWASTLKWNAEWLAGDALYGRPWLVPEALVPAACAYVVVLEAVLVWGVLSHRKALHWPAFAQLCVFHVVSWPVVGFFYPLLMLGLLAIFPLCWLLDAERHGEPRNLLGELFGGRARASAYAFLAGFSALQLVPHAMPGDAALTGEGRLLALHMFDAQVDCRGALELRFSDGRSRTLRLPPPEAPRIRCDPAVSFSLARNACHHFGAELARLDLELEARRAREQWMRPLIRIGDFCRQDLAYDLWRPNDWILRLPDGAEWASRRGDR